MTAFDACPPEFTSPRATDTAYAGSPPDPRALSDEAAVLRLYELATRGANDNPEFAQLDALVYERLMDTYERGAGTAGIIHMGAVRAA